MHGESDVTKIVMNLTSYLPYIPAFTNENPAVGQEIQAVSKRSLHAEQFSILKFWITHICYHSKECAETKTDFLHTQNMKFVSFF